MTLDNDLGRLLYGGLIRLAVEQPEVEYLFRHALVQDAAYASLVRVDRRALHLAVGETLERLQPDLVDTRDLAPLLGRHFAGGGDDLRALKYYTSAGEAAARVYALTEAISHFGAARAALDRLLLRTGDSQVAPPLEPGLLVRLHAGFGTALELGARYDEALDVYGRLESLADQWNDRPLKLAALMARAKIYATGNPRYDPARARLVLEQALELARRGSTEGDRAAEARVLWNLMLLHIFGAGDMHQAVTYGEQAIALSRELNLREQLALATHDIYYAYAYTGRPAQADATLAEARGLWRELGNQAMLADNLSNTSIRALQRGEFETAVELASEALEISRSIDNLWGQATSRFMLGHVYLERGHVGRAIQIMQDTIQVGERAGHPPALIATRADLGWALACLGQPERGLELAQAAAAWSEKYFPLWRSWALSTVARIHIMAGNLDEAHAAAEEARRHLIPGSLQYMGFFLTPMAEGELALSRGDNAAALNGAAEALRGQDRLQVQMVVPDALMLRGRALEALGQREDARSAWTEALAEAESIGSRRSQWPALSALSDLEAEAGNSDKSTELQRRAGEIVEYVAAQIEDDELRASFLGLSSVRRAMGRPTL